VMVLVQGAAVAQSAAGSPSDECVTCAHWQSYKAVNAMRFERGFLVSLNHNVDGVVASTIREVALIKMAQPHWSSSRITAALHTLATQHRSLAMRIKASLAEAVFSEGLVFADDGGYRTDDEVFSAILQTLQQQRYADSGRNSALSVAGKVSE